MIEYFLQYTYTLVNHAASFFDFCFLFRIEAFKLRSFQVIPAKIMQKYFNFIAFSNKLKLNRIISAAISEYANEVRYLLAASAL